MKTQEIKSANFYNNGTSSTININLSNGKTMCKGLELSDVTKLVNKEVSVMDMAKMYFAKN